MVTTLAKPRHQRPAEHVPEPEAQATRSTWRYLPHAVLVTLGTVAAPLASIELIQMLTGETSIILSIVLASCLSAVVASAGSWLWQRRPGSRDILFGDLMLWSWARRLRTERRLRRATKLLKGAAAKDQAHQIEILETLAESLDARDPYTHGHSQRVARNANMIASRMGLSAEEVAKVRVAAAVHDAGKLAVDRAILNKPGALTDGEYEAIKEHPSRGAEMLEPLEEPDIVAMVRHHHERLDGSGYPDGLSGDEIPLGARIIAVADTFDAITSVRPYRRPRKQQVALKILKEEAGTRLDAEAVGVFLTYYTARRTAAWSSLVLTVPERLLGMLSGGAGPIAQGAAATVAAASVGGALVHPVLDIHPRASVPSAVVQHVGQSPAGRAAAADRGERSKDVTTRRRAESGKRSTGRADRTARSRAGDGGSGTGQQGPGTSGSGKTGSQKPAGVGNTTAPKAPKAPKEPNADRTTGRPETASPPTTEPGTSNPGQGQGNGNTGSGGGGSGPSGGGSSGSDGSGSSGNSGKGSSGSSETSGSGISGGGTKGKSG